MDINVIVSLIAAGVAIFTSLLIAGIRVFFYTGDFEREYQDKVESIKIFLKGKINNLVEELLKNYIHRRQTPSIDGIGSEDVGEEEIFAALVREFELEDPFELKDIIDTASEYDRWTKFIKECKENIRKIGLTLILSGMFALVAIGLYVLIQEEVLFAIYFPFGLLIAMILYDLVRSFLDNLKVVDQTYNDIQVGAYEVI